jgi:hypothetical protein
MFNASSPLFDPPRRPGEEWGSAKPGEPRKPKQDLFSLGRQLLTVDECNDARLNLLHGTDRFSA